ncbi:MAG: amidohydrolase family protein, partial [Anaerolineales bacterium]|nr:amidohydrolase family protein [Anaerolineales bacterium]
TPGVPFTWADGPDAVRAKVREVLRYGAHFVKAFNATVPWHKPHLKTNRALYTRAELDALVDEANRAGVPTEIHCFGEEAMLDATQAGADCITHGFPMTERVADEMAERGAWWVPTLMIIFFHANMNPDPLAKKMATEMWEEQVPRAFELAKEKGVRIAMGTDAGYGADLLGKELGLMVQAGLTPAEAIQVSTKNASELLRMDDLVGTLEPGKEADLLVVDGDPLEDIGLLAQIDKLALVMQAGKPISGALTRELPLEYPAYPFFSI